MRLPSLAACIDFRLILSIVLSLAAAPAAAQNPTLLFETLKVQASDGDTGDLFGGSAAIDGDTAVVGATGDDAVGFESGAAYVYQLDPDGDYDWNEVAKLIPSDGASGDLFGTAVGLSGDYLVAGSPFHDAAAADGGAAYVYERDAGGDGAWGEVAKLVPSDPAADELFGISVAVSGDTAVVGAPGAEEGGDTGAVYVFLRDELGAWSEVAKVTASDGAEGDLFGVSVRVDGGRLVAGASQGLPLQPAFGTGAAYVFDQDDADPSIWTEVAKLTAGDGDFGDLFGLSVGVAGDVVVAGSPADDALGNDAGSAYVFERNQGGPGAWGQVKKLTAFNGGANDSFGVAVAIFEDRVVVGTPFDDTDGQNAGAAHVFVRDFQQDGRDIWRQEAWLRASDAVADDFLGRAVAWSGSDVVMGAEGGEAAYLYDLSFFFEPTPTCVLFDGFCDRLDLVADFLTITGTWQNWDCEGADVAVEGFPRGDDQWRVFCLDAGCPLGNFWAHIIYRDREEWDLWGADGGPPPFQVQDDAPITLIEEPCEDVVPLAAGEGARRTLSSLGGGR